MISRSVIVLFIALFAASNATKWTYPNACVQAFNDCDFKFAGKNTLSTFFIGGKQDKAFTPLIVSKNPHENIGVLNMNNITPEFINNNGIATPISYVGNPKFTPTHFKPYAIKYTRGSGVGHQTFHGNQLSVAKGRCVRVFFSTYQLLEKYYPFNVIDNVNVNKYDNKCVVFMTK